MFAERNKVELPGDCVNVLCQVLHRSPLDIIDIETTLAKCKAVLTSCMSKPENRIEGELEIQFVAKVK